MATVNMMVDDLDGTTATGTVGFALDGVAYEIDLSDSNAATLRDFLANYVAAGRRLGQATVGVPPVRVGKPAVDAKAVREWAADEGITVSASGRIPADVVAQYNAMTEARLAAANAEHSAQAE